MRFYANELVCVGNGTAVDNAQTHAIRDNLVSSLGLAHAVASLGPSWTASEPSAACMAAAAALPPYQHVHMPALPHPRLQILCADRLKYFHEVGG